MNEIKDCLRQLVAAWNGNTDIIDQCVSCEPELYFSMYGSGFTKDILKKWFRKRSLEVSVKPLDQVTLTNGNAAFQYAAIVGVYRTDEMYPEHLSFGGTLVAKLIKEKADWKYKIVKFDLQAEDSVSGTYLDQNGMLHRYGGFGKKAILPDWKWIDDRIGHNMDPIPGAGTIAIDAEYDLPWYACKEEVKIKDDEQQVIELLTRLCAAYDEASLLLAKDVFTKNAVYKDKQIELNESRDIIAFFKMARKTVSRSFHAFKLKNVQLNGNVAKVKAVRIAPDLKSSRYIGNFDEQWQAGEYNYQAILTDEGWRINRLEVAEYDAG